MLDPRRFKIRTLGQRLGPEGGGASLTPTRVGARFTAAVGRVQRPAAAAEISDRALAAAQQSQRLCARGCDDLTMTSRPPGGRGLAGVNNCQRLRARGCDSNANLRRVRELAAAALAGADRMQRPAAAGPPCRTPAPLARSKLSRYPISSSGLGSSLIHANTAKTIANERPTRRVKNRRPTREKSLHPRSSPAIVDPRSPPTADNC